MADPIAFLDPSGTARMVAPEQADAAEQAGGKRAVKMLDPSGTARWVSLDQKDAALKAGGRLADAPTTPAAFIAKMRSNLDTNTQDLKPTGGFLHDYVAAPLVHVGNRIAKNVAGPLLDEAERDFTPGKPFDEQVADASAEQDAYIDKFGTSPVATTLETIGNNVPLVPGAGSQIRSYANTKTPVGDMVGDAATLALAHGVARTMPGARPGVPTTPERLRQGFQTALGAGKRNVAAAVKTAAQNAEDAAQATTTANQAAMEKTLKARGAIDRKNAANAEADAKKQADVDAQNVALQQQHVDAVADVDQTNAATLKKDVAKRVAALRNNREAALQHAADTEAAKAQTQENLRLQQDRHQNQTDLNDSSRQLDERVAAAQTRAEAENKARWNALRKEMGDEHTTPAEPVQIAAEAATQDADPATSPLFKRILKHNPGENDVAGFIPEEGPAGNWEEYQRRQEANPNPDEAPPAMDENGLTFGQLQRWRSYLNHKLYGAGRLEPGTFHAYKTMLRGIDTAMDDIATKTGQADNLQAARAGHAQLMETFSDSPNVKQTVASKSLAETSPEFQKEQARSERLAKVAAYDPAVASLSKHIENLRTGLKALPGQAPFREQIVTPPAPPTAITRPEFTAPKPYPEPPTPIPAPEPTKPAEYEEPLPTKAVDVPELDTREMRDKFIDSKMANWTNVSRWQVARLVTGPLGTLVAAVTGHPLYGAASAVYSAAELTPFTLQRMLDRPGFREWATRPPAEELDALRNLPNADRLRISDGLNQVVREAQRQGKPIPVAPALLAFIAQGAAAHQPPKNAGEAKDRVRQLRP